MMNLPVARTATLPVKCDDIGADATAFTAPSTKRATTPELTDANDVVTLHSTISLDVALDGLTENAKSWTPSVI
jgi:hypothetical protein